MRKIKVFNNISLDGYFVDGNGDMSWAHQGMDDPDFRAFVQDNASNADGELLFGRVTYEMMASYWPTEFAAANDPVVAATMNEIGKIAFSNSLDRADWNNTRLVGGDAVTVVRELKSEVGGDIVIFGSGRLVAPLAAAGLIDEYQFVVVPVVLGSGRTLFEGVSGSIALRLTQTRAFGNGNVVLWYESR
jgi:dihydrofolate reductase